VYDPVCGYCSVFSEIAKSQNKASFFGQEIDPSIAAFARMNLFLHGIEADIRCGDTMGEPQFLDNQKKLTQFDVVIADAPFNIKNWAENFNRNDKPDFKMEPHIDPWRRFDWGVPRSSDMAFIMHMAASCASGGRILTVVPPAVLFTGGAAMEIRKKLINENMIDTVISLPEKTFSRTAIPPCILVLKKDRKNKDIVFIDASRSYDQKKISSGALRTRNVLTGSGINDIVKVYQKREPLKNFSYRAGKKEIAANEYDLSIPRYIKPETKETHVDIARVKKEIAEFEEEIRAIDKRIVDCLKEVQI
jgi:type I restriction enzyme M protein